jgi:hypothetical protein
VASFFGKKIRGKKNWRILSPDCDVVEKGQGRRKESG